jgi:hypothetical protein
MRKSILCNPGGKPHRVETYSFTIRIFYMRPLRLLTEGF